MKDKEAIERLKGLFGNGYDEQEEALNMAIKALELLDTLTDRPCSVCRHNVITDSRSNWNGEEPTIIRSCCKWDCVFDGHIGGKE